MATSVKQPKLKETKKVRAEDCQYRWCLRQPCEGTYAPPILDARWSPTRSRTRLQSRSQKTCVAIFIYIIKLGFINIIIMSKKIKKYTLILKGAERKRAQFISAYHAVKVLLVWNFEVYANIDASPKPDCTLEQATPRSCIGRDFPNPTRKNDTAIKTPLKPRIITRPL